jgi:hypothetical protein
MASLGRVRRLGLFAQAMSLPPERAEALVAALVAPVGRAVTSIVSFREMSTGIDLSADGSVEVELPNVVAVLCLLLDQGEEAGVVLRTFTGETGFVLDGGRQIPVKAATEGLIGQFGVGFYSSFMVADEVTLLTRRAGESRGTRWTSKGEGTYAIETVHDAPQGTAVVLHLKPEDAEDRLYDYTSPWKIKEMSNGTRTSSPGPSGWSRRPRTPTAPGRRAKTPRANPRH